MVGARHFFLVAWERSIHQQANILVLIELVFNGEGETIEKHNK